MNRALPCIALAVLSACSSTGPRGLTEVSFAMWAGDEHRTRHFRGAVTDALRRHGIELRILPFSDSAEIVNKLINEKAAGRSRGSVDLVWINGENFRTAKQTGVLQGPFADSLPNARLYPDSARERDFGTPIEGFEAPWQRAQFVLAYDTARVPEPPRSLDGLREWVKSHPGRFTYVAPPDFTGSAFIRHVLLACGDGEAAFRTFDEAHYARAAGKAIACLRSIRLWLWRRGETYPTTVREHDRLFANGEIDFAMNYNPSFASARVERGEFPPGTRTFVFDSGTLANYSYLAIPFNAPNPHGAMAAANHLMSFEQTLELSRALRTPFAQDPARLSAAQRRQVDLLPRGPATLPDDVLNSHSLPEPHAEYLSRFEKDWVARVLRP